LRRARLPRKRELPWARDRADEGSPVGEPPLSGIYSGAPEGNSGRTARTRLKPRTWLRLSRILRVDGLLKRRQLHFGTGRLLVLGLQICEGLNNSRVTRSYVDEVRHLVRNTHRFYNDVSRGIFIPWGLNTFGKSLNPTELKQFSRSPNLAQEIRISPGGFFRRLISRRFPVDLSVFLRLNDAGLMKVFRGCRFRPVD